MIKIEFDVMGKKWVVRVLKHKKYSKKNGEDSLAVTLSWKRRMDITLPGVNLETIVHELTHAYLAEMCVSSCNEITLEDQEEVFAELLAKRGRELLDTADKLHAEIIKQIEHKAAIQKEEKLLLIKP